MNQISVSSLFASLVESFPQQVPGVSLITDTWKRYQAKQLHYFLEDIDNGVKNISIDEVHKNDVLQNLYLTLNAVEKAKTREQTKLYSELYCNYLRSDLLSLKAHNNYELILNLLTNLTQVEFQLLLLLNKHEVPYRVSNKDKPQQVVSTDDYWNLFIVEAQTAIELDSELINNLLSILEAKGMFYRARNHGFYNNDNGFGTLTPAFKSILTYLSSSNYATNK